MADLDRERTLIKVAQLDGYLRELADIAPRTFAEYQGIEKKRACERLLQLSVEAVIDICSVLVAGQRLGLPAEEEDLIHKLTEGHVLSPEMGARIRKMKGLRNVLVHEYTRIDDRLVYQALKERVKDFVAFKQEVLANLKR